MKVLISADIHIDDYADFNYNHRFRLRQFDKLATRLVEIGKQYNCKEHWILGDIVNRPNSRKYVEHAAKRFLKVQSDNFDIVRFILGQHDCESKTQHFDIEDTLITMFDFPNFKYMDREVLVIDDHNFGFLNWRPEQDLDWLGDTHLDVLFGHYTKSTLFGQEIDETKFDLMIHGDIHNSQVIGKFISVCNPLQKDMSSEKDGKVIIFDTETLEWERVLTDPDHTRFLQIDYTEDRALEGFEGPLTYHIYRPNILSDSTDERVKTLTWNDIDDLIKQTCDEKDLASIHDEVESKCVPYSEIDFNFQINKLKIRGYRSIVDLEFDFNKGDRVALLGDNGSGKSSVIRALQGVFLRNSYLKYEQSDFTDDMEVTVNLTYQNKVFELTKGTQWKLLIDGQEQSYNNLTEFEKDLPIKLPFLEYLDLFFITSNVQNLSSQFNPTRRIELISKFYRLDRIQAYYQTASGLWNSYNKLLNDTKSELNVQSGILDHINKRLSELRSSIVGTKEDIISELKQLSDAREGYTAYQNWLKQLEQLKSRLNDSFNRLEKYRANCTFDIDQGQIDLQDLKIKADQTNDAYEKTYQASITFESTLKDIKLLEDRGKILGEKVSSLESGKCPECQAPLSQGKASDMLASSKKELDELRQRWSELDDIINSHPRKYDSKSYYLKTLSQLKTAYKELKDGIELLNNKIMQCTAAKAKLDAEQVNYDNLQLEFKKFQDSKPEEIQLPLDISKRESDLNSTLSLINELDSQMISKESQLEKIEEIKSTVEELYDRCDKYSRYMELTSMTGEIYEQILRQLSDKFSTTEVKYEVDSGIYRGSRFINFNSYYNSKGTYRIYESCSDGQRTICDLDFLSKLFSVQVGILVLDEYLKHLDEKNFPKACEILKDINVNTLLLSTHDMGLSVYTKRIVLNLDDNGESRASIV